MPKITRQILINCLMSEYKSLMEDDPWGDGELSVEQYASHLEGCSYEQLIAETSTDEKFNLQEFVEYFDRR